MAVHSGPAHRAHVIVLRYHETQGTGASSPNALVRQKSSGKNATPSLHGLNPTRASSKHGLNPTRGPSVPSRQHREKSIPVWFHKFVRIRACTPRACACTTQLQENIKLYARAARAPRARPTFICIAFTHVMQLANTIQLQLQLSLDKVHNDASHDGHSERRLTTAHSILAGAVAPRQDAQ
jgi:hypothetical protein